MSRKEPDPVPPATEPTMTMRKRFVSMRKPSSASWRSCDRPAFSAFSFKRILSRIFAYLSKKYRRDTARIWPAPLLMSKRSSRMRCGVSGSHSLMCGYFSKESSSRLYLSMSNDSTTLSSSVNFTWSNCKSFACDSPLSITAPLSRSKWMNCAMGKSASPSMRVRWPAPPHRVLRMRRRTRISTCMPVPPMPMNRVGRSSMILSCLRSLAPPGMVWFRFSAMVIPWMKRVAA